MAAVVVAAAGAPVVKHGNRAASSAAGSADVLEALGVAVDLAPDAVGECVAEAGIAFCFAPVFHPGMRHAAVARRELGVATVFNVLGPLANPARPRRAGRRLRRPAARPRDGRRRCSTAAPARSSSAARTASTSSRPHAPTRIWDATGSAVVESVVDAVDLGVARSRARTRCGAQDAAYNADVAPGGARRRAVDRRSTRCATRCCSAPPAALVAHDAALAARQRRRARSASGSRRRCRARPRRSTPAPPARLLDALDRGLGRARRALTAAGRRRTVRRRGGSVEADGERRLEVVAAVGAERDVRLGRADARRPSRCASVTAVLTPSRSRTRTSATRSRSPVTSRPR